MAECSIASCGMCGRCTDRWDHDDDEALPPAESDYPMSMSRAEFHAFLCDPDTGPLLDRMIADNAAVDRVLDADEERRLKEQNDEIVTRAIREWFRKKEASVRRDRAHTHPCSHCQTPVECPGTFELNFDGFPAVVCELFETNPNDHLCETCHEKHEQQAVADAAENV